MPARVLIADGHALVREGLRLILARHAEVTVVGEAPDGREAVAQALALRPDLVLMEAVLPALNGIDATARIRRALPRTSVLIVSARRSSELVHRALAAGAGGYVRKESDARELVSAMLVVLRGRRYLGPGLADVTEAGRRQTGRSPLERLSAREREIVQLVAEGHSSRHIAARAELSRPTVDTYRSRAMSKLGVANVAELVRFAVAHGLV